MEKSHDAKANDWDRSYARRENHLYWPSDGVIRFVSKYLRKRLEPNLIVDVAPDAKGSRVLDLGCGIGRHINFGIEMGLEMYGLELSAVAVSTGHKWLKDILPLDPRIQIREGDVREIPWEDGFFDHALSDSVIDSMSFDIAKSGIAELARVIKSGGYLYCSLIADLDETGQNLYSGERIQNGHENGTIQSYFNEEKIKALFTNSFELLSQELHMVGRSLTNFHSGRWHLIMRRK